MFLVGVVIVFVFGGDHEVLPTGPDGPSTVGRQPSPVIVDRQPSSIVTQCAHLVHLHLAASHAHLLSPALQLQAFSVQCSQPPAAARALAPPEQEVQAHSAVQAQLAESHAQPLSAHLQGICFFWCVVGLGC